MKKKQKQRSQSHDTTDSSDANTSSGCLHFHVYVFIFVFGADMHPQWNVIISNVLHSTHFPHTFSVQWHNDTTAFQYIFVAFFWFRAKKKQFYCYHDFLSATRFKSVLAPYWLTMKWYYSTNRYYVYDIIICDELNVSIYRRKKKMITK